MKKNYIGLIKNRVLAFVLAICFVANLVPNYLVINTSAEDEEEEFNVYTYIVDDILSRERFYFYLDSVSPMAKIWSESMTPQFEQSVLAWESVNLILDPSDAAKKSIDAKGYYMSILLTILNSTYEQETIINKMNSSLVKTPSSIYGGLAKCFKEISNAKLDDYISKNSFSKDEIALFNAAQEEYLENNKLLAGSTVASDIIFALDVSQKPQEYVEQFIQYSQLYTISSEWKSLLAKMYSDCDKSNYALSSALETVVSASSDLNNSVLELWKDGLNDTGSVFLEYAISGLLKTTIEKCPVVAGMKLGKTIGTTLTNMLFSTDKVIEQYYIICAYCDILELIRSEFKSVMNEYLSDSSTENAQKFLTYMDMYFTVLDVGNDFGQQFNDVMYNSGIVTKLFRSEDGYKNTTANTKMIADGTKEAYKYFSYAWTESLYYDNSEMYEIYADIVDASDIVGIYLPVSSVEFENESVEWGLYDGDYSGYKCNVYPENATAKELVYSTSDSSVAEISDDGILSVNGIGNCVITATSVDNEDISDELFVTVCAVDGANSTPLEEINDIVPDQNYISSDFKFTINDDDTVTITGYTGIETNLIIPSTIGGRKVTSIGEKAFRWHILTSVTIPSSVTFIGDGAFSYCEWLTNITIPDGVTSIGQGVFSGCTSLASITIPDSLTSIGDWTFSGCTSLTSIMIPDNIVSTGECTFYGCTSLTSITIPNSVTSIEGYAFYGCTSLASITIPDSVTSIGSQAFECCSSLANITIPNSVIFIGDDAFYKCTSLTSITIPDSVTFIGSGAFSGCTKLPSINIEANKEYKCVDGVLFNNDMSEIKCFPGGKSKNYAIPSSVTSIDCHAFRGCTSLASITITNSVISIGERAFEGCTSLTCITIPDSVTAIEDYAFCDCTSLTSITIPNSVTSIEEKVFSGCSSLTSITIPDNVTSIGEWAFYNCTSLISITFPDSVTSIEDGAFCECISLTSITIPNSVISIGERAFEGCTSLTSITIPDSVTSIGDGAFSSCSSLTSITIPDSVTSIGNGTFWWCTSLTSIAIPDGVTSIGYNIFWFCTNLASVTIPDGVTSIGSGAFYNCTSLQEVTIPKSVTSIETYWGDDNVFGNTGSDFKLKVYSNSEAHKYAERFDIPYILLDAEPNTHPPITGTITNFNTSGEITVQLLDSDKNVIETVTSTDGSYSFTTNTSGQQYYILVSMPKFAPREYSLTGSGAAQTLDMEIRKYGDIYADGVVDAKDTTQILRYEAGLPSIFDNSDDYAMKVANVISTDELSAKDATQILRYEAGMTSVFDTLN